MADPESLPVILVVDDMEVNQMILEEILQDTYRVITAGNGEEGLNVLRNAEVLPKLVLLDVFMPVLTGYQMFEIMKADESFKRIPVIFITTSDSEGDALAAGAVDFISKPFNSDIVKLRVKNQVALKNYSDNLEEMVVEKTAENTATLDNTLQALANIIEYRNLESGSHVKRTQFFCKAIVEYLLKGSSPYTAELRTLEPEVIYKSMALHDVGKIGIPDRILLKPGRLEPDEYDIMKTHTTVGKNIIEQMMRAVSKDSMYLRHCRDIAFSHHERWDGQGYPQGLKGKEIPLSSRIASLADVYDALVSVRVYKRSMSFEDAIEIIRDGKEVQFDPLLTEVVIDIQDTFREISSEFH